MVNMNRHRSRYLLIAIVLCVTVVALVIGTTLGLANDKAITALVTAIGLLTPALVDAHLVERRRKDPALEPVTDNVLPSTDLRN